MSDNDDRMCVLLPIGSRQHWAVPQACLAEILTLQSEGSQPPAQVTWRGQEIPVLDPEAEGDAPWLDASTGAGLLAVVLGEAGKGCDYWAVALRGRGLSVRQLVAEDCEDRPADALEHALAAFLLDETLYQVPDLPALQQQAVAASAA